jgi:hypothetical protein
MSFEKSTLSPGFTHRDVIPNRAEGRVRDLTSDAAIPAVDGTAWLPLEVIQ